MLQYIKKILDFMDFKEICKVIAYIQRFPTIWVYPSYLNAMVMTNFLQMVYGTLLNVSQNSKTIM